MCSSRLAALVLAAVAGFGTPARAATDGRAAPFITRHPKVDGTDLYAFRSYEPGRQDFVTFMAAYQPYQNRESGPVYYPMDPAALYEIHVDNAGDCKEHLTFQFRFQNAWKDLKLQVGDKPMSVPYPVLSPLSAADQSGLNQIETYTVTVVRGDRRTGDRAPAVNAATGGTGFQKPIDFVGPRAFGSADAYKAFTDAFIWPIQIPGCAQPGRVWVGQRDDYTHVVAQMYELFDVDITTPVPGYNELNGWSNTVIALELPTACVVADPSKPVIGAWTTASLRQGRLLNPRPSFNAGAMVGGPWTQVSREGNPLVKPFFIGLPDKDAFNAARPSDDARFLVYFTNPVLPALIQSTFSFVAPAPPRNDLVAAYLTGIKGLNQTGAACEMLRLDTSIPPAPLGNQNQYGALGCVLPGLTVDKSQLACDAAGFPNGRRPGDNVMAILLRMDMGAMLPPDQAPDGGRAFGQALNVGDQRYLNAFPYGKIAHTHDDPSN